MARHNRTDRGTDQRGYDYEVNYQPDWLSAVKVTRELESGRQSTKTLHRNPGRREQHPGPKVRTRITSPQQGVDFEITIHDPKGIIKRVIVETELPAGKEGVEEVVFALEDVLPPPPPDDEDPNGRS